MAREADPRRHAAFFHRQGLQTPCLLIDLEMVAARFRELAEAMPAAGIYYAVKAQPHPAVLDILAGLGSSFDVASRAELDLCLARGVPAERISYGTTIKLEEDIAYAHRCGVGLFALDSQCELEKIARAASGAGVMCRILVDSAGAQWPLSRKFGCSPDMAADLLAQARALGLQPRGVSFHPGSQQRDPTAWQAGCHQAAGIFSQLSKKGLSLSLLNLGGGFPACYDAAVPDIGEYAKAIEAAVQEAFGWPVPRIVEPGRFIAGDAGVLRSQVVTISRKSHADPLRWIYVDTGRFAGLAETEGEAIRYPIITEPDRGGATGRVVLAGRSCDSIDIIQEHAPLYLPMSLQVGDYVDFGAAGAYTDVYASAGFNGFAPPQVHCFGGRT